MSTLTVLSLLAALEPEHVETQVLILADALEEAGRSDLAEWCRTCGITPSGKRMAVPGGTVIQEWAVFAPGLTRFVIVDTESAARAELLRRVWEHVGVRCDDCGWLHELVAAKMLPPKWIECTTCHHGLGYTGLRPEPVVCGRCGGRGRIVLHAAGVRSGGIRACPDCRGTVEG